jgi:hypothetical protein
MRRDHGAPLLLFYEPPSGLGLPRGLLPTARGKGRWQLVFHHDGADVAHRLRHGLLRRCACNRRRIQMRNTLVMLSPLRCWSPLWSECQGAHTRRSLSSSVMALHSRIMRSRPIHIRPIHIVPTHIPPTRIHIITMFFTATTLLTAIPQPAITTVITTATFDRMGIGDGDLLALRKPAFALRGASTCR